MKFLKSIVVPIAKRVVVFVLLMTSLCLFIDATQAQQQDPQKTIAALRKQLADADQLLGQQQRAILNLNTAISKLQQNIDARDKIISEFVEANDRATIEAIITKYQIAVKKPTTVE